MPPVDPRDLAHDAALLLDSLPDSGAVTVLTEGQNRNRHVNLLPTQFPLFGAEGLPPAMPELEYITEFPADLAKIATDNYGDLKLTISVSRHHKYEVLPVTDHPGDVIYMVAYIARRKEIEE